MIVSILLAFIVTANVILLIRPLALRLGLVDQPGGRKQHHGVVPLIGGLAICCGFMIAVLTLPFSLGQYRALFVAAIMLVFVGTLDDFKELSPKARLAAQFIACLLISLWGNVVLENLGDLLFLGNINLGWLALPLTWFGILSLINSVNMMDGLDGLAGGISLFSFLAMAALCFMKADWMNFYVLLIAASCLCAFLVFNWRAPFGKFASVFMGDAGSLFLGTLLAWFSISLTQGSEAVARPVTMLWLIALPLMDLLAVFIRRIAHHRSPLQAGHEHLHYVLQKRGFSSANSVYVMWGLSLSCITIGLLGELFHIKEGFLFIGFVALFLAYFTITS